MLASSTHDTKRGEDVRARIAVLSELPDLWKLHLSRWTRLNRAKRRQVEGSPAPDREDEYLFYQTLTGVWSADEDASSLVERLQAYMLKAAREAKRSTSWINPNTDYEKALVDFVAHVLEHPDRNAFLHDFTTFIRIIAFFGRINSLALTALKIASPGLPDFYQGTERTALTLVDPDNRRPVDFDGASRELDELLDFAGSPRSLLDDANGAKCKLYVTSRLLRFRKERPDLFARGAYQALQVDGERKDHVFAFARTFERHSCVVMAPRWTAKLMAGAPEPPLGENVWGDTRVAVGQLASLQDLFSCSSVRTEEQEGSRWVRAAEVFAQFPVAVLKTTAEAASD
jgi:(1->4)-alpha-D-glucan 1-alpha-D-glucosylmutase